ncbi:hypothetical protein BB559_003023 [Furculomyces boomerangus]|uniref:AB hydrolase-1 domain-containing protein n=1 Tax=Furculomyces boomerangus TaxID=61424 RepID=A0A2T9YPX8_9FUNG|nr:hypothetical protein BB559_003023 [Furculomyces boomerangus]
MNRTIIKNLISTTKAFSGHLNIPANNGKIGKLYIEDSGETRDTKGVLVCFPGIGDVRTSFRFLVDSFVPKGYRTIIADIRGMGDSWEGFDEFSPESVATDISQVIKQRQLTQNVILVGNSLSAGSCILSAAQHSDIVKGKFVRAPKNGVENSIPNLTCPTIAIYGDQDPDFSDVPKEKEWLLNKTKDHKNVDAFILEKVGHYPHVEAFDETESIIDQFLNKVL